MASHSVARQKVRPTWGGFSSVGLLCLGLGATLGMKGSAQVPLAFAAVSIKAIRPGSAGRSTIAPIIADPGRLHLARLNLRALIAYAYGVKYYQVLTAEAWTGTEFFDFDASTGAPATDQELRLMMRRALTARVGLRLSKSTPQTPLLALVGRHRVDRPLQHFVLSQGGSGEGQRRSPHV